MLIALILTGIGFACGLIIYLANVLVPRKVQGLEKTEEISCILPGINCGACGKPGCFAYAQALTKDADIITKSPCTVVLQDTEGLERLEKALGMTLDASQMSKKALIRCSGNSEDIYNYSGVKTCKGAAQLLSGYKRCPYACPGLGDCLVVCPHNAISIVNSRQSAVGSPGRGGGLSTIDYRLSTIDYRLSTIDYRLSTIDSPGVAVIDPEKCTGCGLCLVECPLNLIELLPGGTKIAFLCNYAPLRDIPGREKCDAGCIHCRKCFKICEDEAIVWNKEKAIPEFDIEKCTRCGKCIEICPNRTLVSLIS